MRLATAGMVAVRRELEALPAAEAVRDALSRLFETHPVGMVLLDAARRIVHANRAARGMAGQGDAFALTDTMTALRDTDAGPLQAAIGGALRGQTVSLRLPRRTSAADYLVVAMPLVAGMACVTLVDPAASAVLSTGLLRTLFGLTAMECRIAQLLVDGHAIDAAGMALGMRALTARSHLRAIFRKTACRRQVELVRLLLALPAPDDGA